MKSKERSPGTVQFRSIWRDLQSLDIHSDKGLIYETGHDQVSCGAMSPNNRKDLLGIDF